MFQAIHRPDQSAQSSFFGSFSEVHTCDIIDRFCWSVAQPRSLLQSPAVLGSDYTITPDIVVVRDSENDSAINAAALLVDDSVITLASLRKKNGGLPLLHASISCTWTIRSDRAQNARSGWFLAIQTR